MWRVETHPRARAVPFAPHHHHPAVKGVHWDGVVPRFPYVRLDPSAPSIGPYLRHGLRHRGRTLLGSDGAFRSYGLDAPSAPTRPAPSLRSSRSSRRARAARPTRAENDDDRR